MALTGGPCSRLGKANTLFTLCTEMTPGRSCHSVPSPDIPSRGRTGALASGMGKGAVDLEVFPFAIAAAMPEPKPAKGPAALTLIPRETKGGSGPDSWLAGD